MSKERGNLEHTKLAVAVGLLLASEQNLVGIPVQVNNARGPDETLGQPVCVLLLHKKP